jgi:hypothetical protein
VVIKVSEEHVASIFRAELSQVGKKVGYAGEVVGTGPREQEAVLLT